MLADHSTELDANTCFGLPLLAFPQGDLGTFGKLNWRTALLRR